jgi:phytoene desaturase
MKPMKKVMIIGAGTAGLASAIRLQTLGYDVSIFEKNDRVGGRMFQLVDRGFKFDYGPTITMLPDEYRDVFTFSGVNPEDYIPMTPLDPLYTLYFQDDTSIEISSHLPKLMKQLEIFGEEDQQGYLNYLEDVYERYIRARNVFLNKSYRKPLDFFNFRNAYHGLRLRTLNNAYDSISKFVKSEKLRQALAFQTLYIGISPFQGPSIYTIIPMIEIMYGIHYLKGGMYAMAEGMSKRFLEMGGTIHLNQEVSEIVTKDGQAIGIDVQGHFYEADIVLTNADFPWAVENLIKQPLLRGKYQPQKVKKMTYSSSVMIIYLGLSKKYNTHIHSLRFAKDFKQNINDLFEGRLPDDPSFYLYSPTQIDASLAPEGKEILYILVPIPNMQDYQVEWNETETALLRDKILSLVSKIPTFEDILKHIEVMHVSTPKDWEEKFHLNYGATFGLRPTLKQSLYFRPQAVATKLKNVYFTGTSTHPGPGVPIVLMSAKLAVNEIVKDHPHV